MSAAGRRLSWAASSPARRVPSSSAPTSRSSRRPPGRWRTPSRRSQRQTAAPLPAILSLLHRLDDVGDSLPLARAAARSQAEVQCREDTGVAFLELGYQLIVCPHDGDCLEHFIAYHGRHLSPFAFHRKPKQL